MKKNLFFISVAVLALSSCNNDTVVDENLSANQPKEIAIQAIATPTTRAAVNGTTFTPTTMEVAAWDVTNGRDFFTATTFTKDASTWKGGKYWPLSAAYINFLAYTEFNGTSATWNKAGDGKAASGVTLVMTDNKTAQKDLMYAIGHAEVTQTSNTLNFPTDPVSMTFKHAQAWVCFMADAYDATSGGKVTLKSITLNGAKYNGTYVVTHTNYDASSSQSVAGVWTVATDDAQDDIAVPNWTEALIAYDGTGDGVTVGDGLLIVPDDNASTADFTSFTIAYSLDGNDYTYTYTPQTAAAANVDQAKKYTFKINFHLHEIEIAPSVTDWQEGGPTDVPIF